MSIHTDLLILSCQSDSGIMDVQVEASLLKKEQFQSDEVHDSTTVTRTDGSARLL